MARPHLQPIQERDLQGFKYFRLLLPLLDRLHDNATQRDRAGNRRLFFDQYACLLLLFFFNPIIRSLRGAQRASQLEKVQKLLGCKRVSRGSLSEASGVFDPALLQQVIGELVHRVVPLADGRDLEALRDLAAVDGSLLPALPKMAWALWKDKLHRAAKIHVHFHVLKAVPARITVTAGNDSERDQLQASLEPGGFYVVDRGYRDWNLFQEIIAAKASFVARVQNNTVIHAAEERPLTAEARAAGIVRDVVIEQTGNERHKNLLKYPLRILVIDSGKRLLNGRPDLLILCTNRLDLPAELVGLAYKFRWTVELFFRWFKCILGCRHLLSTGLNGVTLQVYLGVIASLLISLWCGKKPTRITLEMIQFYLIGWATEKELLDHIARLKDHA
jgi:DDE family transposase